MDTIKRVEELAAQKGLSLRQLTEKSDVAYSTIKNAKARSYQLSVDTIERLCVGLDITLSDFFAKEATARGN